MESITATLSTMDAKNADAVFQKASSPPPAVTPPQREKAARIAKKAEQHYRTLEINWFFPRYSGFSAQSKKLFLQKIEAQS